MRKILIISFLLSTIFSFAGNVINLSGTWHATLENDGSQHNVTLPGSLLTNNLGDELSVDTKWTGSLYDSSFYYNPYMAKYRQKGRMKFPFFLTPNRHYIGNVVYKRNVFIPKSWKGKHITLFLERPHIETTVTVNGMEVGHQMSLSTPHVYDLSQFVKPGKNNEITVKVYNGIENVCVGQDSHSVTDQTQGNWNGIVGRIELQCHGKQPVWQARVLDTDLQHSNITVEVSAEAKKLDFIVDGKSVASKLQTVSDGKQVYRLSLATGYNKHLNSLAIASKDDTLRTVFGFCKPSIDGMQIYVNRNDGDADNNGKIWIRGTVENCDFPLTGYPPTDVESWRKIFTKCKQYGLNAMRFHSYCPPEAAFTAADEFGFYLAPEGPSWPNHGVKLRRGMYIDKYLMDETKRIVDTYGNHPSFIMLSAGNEPAGDWVTWGNHWVDSIKQYDHNRRLYCSFNVGGGWAWDNGSEYHVKGGARGLDWSGHAPQSVDDYYQQLLFPRNRKDTVPNNSPMISHEQGQWCAFPDLDERSQYTGVYKAYNFDIFADLLRDNGMASMAKKFLYASGKLQTLCYKYEIERNLRTKDYSGFMLLGLNDYSGQGTALVGPLNVFWREKGYVDSTEWRQFCNDVVVMAEFPKFVFETGDTCNVDIDVYNAGDKNMNSATLRYSIQDPSASNTSTNSSSVSSTKPRKVIGSFNLPLGKNLKIAKAPLTIASPGKYTLTLKLQSDGKTFTNTYDYWVYDSVVAVPCAGHQPSVLKKASALKTQMVAGTRHGHYTIFETDTLNDKAIKVLQQGGKVLITAAGKVRYGNDVKQTYLPVFWNTSWFKMRPPHTTGAYIAKLHPLFKEFPTDDWANLNWWELLNKAQIMNLAELPKDYQSPIQPIDTWHVSRKLGMLIEANVLNGKLLMTTMDISNDLEHRPVARQMRKAIIDYMQSNDFKPTISLHVQTIQDFFTKTAPAVNMYTKDSPDELKPKVK